jgi:tetratricopeptide (TPR) repeat protein
VTYPQPFVQDIIEQYCAPAQVNNTLEENKPLIERFRHIWTPDLRVLDASGYELYRWNGYLPPAEFAAQLLVALGQARLRLRQFDAAERHYADALQRFPTALAGAEAQYFAGVTAYRKTGEPNALLHGWHELEKTYPGSQWAVKQNFD